MKSRQIWFTAGVVIVLACVCITVNSTSQPVTVPFIAWSPENFLSGRNEQILQKFSNEQVQEFVRALIGYNTPSPLINHEAKQSPELIFVFVENWLQTAELSFFSRAHSVGVRDGGSMSYVKESLETSMSSVYVPYGTFGESGVSIVHSLTQEFLVKSPHSSIIIAHEGAYGQYAEYYEHIPYSDALSFIQQNAANLVSNSQTDLLIIVGAWNKYNDPRNVLQTHNELLHSIIDEIKKHSTNFIAAYAGDELATEYQRASVISRAGNVSLRNTTNTTTPSGPPPNMFANRWPSGVIEGLFLTVILLIFLFIGLCCTCCIQTPSRFESVKQKQN